MTESTEYPASFNFGAAMRAIFPWPPRMTTRSASDMYFSFVGVLVALTLGTAPNDCDLFHNGYSHCHVEVPEYCCCSACDGSWAKCRRGNLVPETHRHSVLSTRNWCSTRRTLAFLIVTSSVDQNVSWMLFAFNPRMWAIAIGLIGCLVVAPIVSCGIASAGQMRSWCPMPVSWSPTEGRFCRRRSCRGMRSNGSPSARSPRGQDPSTSSTT